jgi:hypothetical protein
MVMAEGVFRRDRMAVHDRRLPDEAVLGRRLDEGFDGAPEPEACEVLRLAAPGAEARTPEQALGLVRAERPRADGKGAHHDKDRHERAATSDAWNPSNEGFGEACRVHDANLHDHVHDDKLRLVTLTMMVERP